MPLVTFSGIDGAGKSTLISALRRRLQEAGFGVLVLAFWQDVAVLRRLREATSVTVFGGDAGVGSPDKPAARRDKNVQSLPVIATRLVMYLLDAARLRRVVARSRRAPVQIILFDRYLYDEIANLPLSGRWARVYACLLLRLAPKPDLACLVDADPAVARGRKPEYPLDFLQSNRANFLALSELLGGMLLISSPTATERETSVLEQLRTMLYSATCKSPIPHISL